MEFIILTLSNFLIATGMVLVVYYKWFKSDEQKDAEIKRLRTNGEKLVSQNLILEAELEASREKCMIQRQSYIEELLEMQDEYLEKEGEYSAKVQNLETKLRKFDRQRDPKTGQFIKSKR